MDDIVDELFKYVDAHTIKSFTNQVIRGNNLNVEFQFTRRGFEFYAGYNADTIQCQFGKDEVWQCKMPNAVSFFKEKIRAYMIAKSIWDWECKNDDSTMQTR